MGRSTLYEPQHISLYIHTSALMHHINHYNYTTIGVHTNHCTAHYCMSMYMYVRRLQVQIPPEQSFSMKIERGLSSSFLCLAFEV